MGGSTLAMLWIGLGEMARVTPSPFRSFCADKKPNFPSKVILLGLFARVCVFEDTIFASAEGASRKIGS